MVFPQFNLVDDAVGREVAAQRVQLRVERLADVRARIAEADADPRASVPEEDIVRHFEERLRQSLVARGEHA